MIDIPLIGTATDEDVQNISPSARTLDTTLWPLILVTVLWHLGDARNGVVFRNEDSSVRCVLTIVSNDLVICEKIFCVQKLGVPALAVGIVPKRACIPSPISAPFSLVSF